MTMQTGLCGGRGGVGAWTRAQGWERVDGWEQPWEAVTMWWGEEGKASQMVAVSNLGYLKVGEVSQ